ncbi:MAG: hypothetical protein J3Q66DRAFT_353795 [Benniella sp.]|nr:MAG: hypothetical protein J3Q66DRAFT_353795 [Benniella sp.]
MIAVDYKDKDKDVGAAAVTPTVGANTSKRLSLISEESRSQRESRPGIQITTTFQDDADTKGINGSHGRASLGSDKRRSIIIQAGGGEGSSFSLDNTPFLLDSFALDADYVMPSSGPTDRKQPREESNGRHSPTKPGQRETKVKFNISEQTPMDEDSISKSLADRIANHKVQMASVQTVAITNDSIASALLKAPEVVLPRPAPRKKVRHVQIQTQHCIMRTMHTQTEPVDSLVQDAEVKVLRARPTTTECSTDTADISTSTDGSTSLHSTNAASKPNAKVATITTSISTSTTTSTNTPPNPSTPLTVQEQQELAQLRQHNAVLLAQVTSLQRDLAAETRARTRAAVAMQDTREKFEMLSAIAYKKLKEMIFQRHVLEMEVRELRARVDMQVEEKEMIHQQTQHAYRHQHQHSYQQHHHQQQGFVAVGPN